MAKDVPVRKPKKRRLLKIVAGLLVAIIVAVAALPWLLGSSMARGFLLAKINASVGPGHVEADAFRFSWSGPIVAENLVLKGADGEAILIAPSAVWDRGLWRLLTDRPHYGTVTLDGAKIDLERRADGSLNLVRALGLERKDPAPDHPQDPPHDAHDGRPDVILKVVHGSLRVRTPEMPEPLIADTLDMTVNVAALPEPLSWHVAMGRNAGETLEIAGEIDKDFHMTLDMTANRWPAYVKAGGATVRGRLDGKVGVRRKGGAMDLLGDARLLDMEAAGPALGGDRLALATFGGSWDVTQGAEGWSIRRLDLKCPVASIRSQGAIPAAQGEPAAINGHLDLAALAKQLPHALKLREGVTLQSGGVLVRVDVSEVAGSQKLDVQAKVSELVALERGRERPIVLRDPATLTSRLMARGADVQVVQLGVRSEWLVATGSGNLDEGVHMSASFDLAGMERQLRDLVDLEGVKLGGRGALKADYRREGASYTARASGEVRDLAADGVASSPIRRDAVKFSAVASGTADVSGLPISWKTARAGVAASDLAASAEVEPRDGGWDVKASASLTAATPKGPSRASARIVGSYVGSRVDMSEFHAEYAPADASAAIAFSAKGRYDRALGAVDLKPLADHDDAPLHLNPDGLRISGLGSPGGWKLEGDLGGDLAAIDRSQAAYLGSTPRGMDGPISLSVRASYDAKADRLDLAQLTASTRYAGTILKGSIAEFSGKLVADITGPVALDKAFLDAQVAATAGPDARVEITPRSIRVRGPLSGENLWKTLIVDAGIDVAGARASGLRLGATSIVAHMEGGRVAIDPIRGTLNDGQVVILSEMTMDDPKGITFRLLDGSSVLNAAIDDDVSRKLLTYIAPVLNDATQVSGKVSFALERAEFPLGGDASRQVTLAGRIDLVGLRFGPGPAARQVLDLASLGREPEILLNESIKVAVSERRVYQRGLTIPVGRDEKISIDGSVGFDQTLDLYAQVPLPTAELARRIGLDEPRDAATARVPVQIKGTFARPSIDRQALARALKTDSGKELEREAKSKAADLLRRLAAPDSNRRRQ